MDVSERDIAKESVDEDWSQIGHLRNEEELDLLENCSTLRALWVPSPHKQETKAASITPRKALEEPKLRILVVDDSAATRKMITRFLKMSEVQSKPGRWDVVESRDGAEAVNALRTSLAPDGSFDLFLVILCVMRYFKLAR